MMKKSVLKAVHETASDLHKAEVMSEKIMRDFDALCLSEVKDLDTAQIKLLKSAKEAR